jgi:thiol-disulfide isomerase/thioredoxin
MTNGNDAPKRKATRQRKSRRVANAASARRRARRAIAAWIVLGAVMVGGVLTLAIRSDQRGGGTGVTDAAAFDLPALGSEGRVRLADFTGRPTVVNFFASWCTQCDAELPDFRAAAVSLEGDVHFVFVNSNETGNWRPMAERHDLLEFPVARDVGGANGNGLYRSLGGTGGMPMTAFYDANGRLIDRAFGALTGGLLSDALEQFYGVTVNP